MQFMQNFLQQIFDRDLQFLVPIFKRFNNNNSNLILLIYIKHLIY